MANYDPAIIHRYADALYQRADSIVLGMTVIGVLIGLLVGIAFGAMTHASGGIPILLIAALGGAIGYSIGRQKAFALRLEAQVALCQAQIEENTRRT